MILERLKSAIVSHLSYFLGSENEAAVIDPERDCQIYLRLANQNDMKIKYILETHRNEDFITGSKELAYLSGAEVYHGPWPEFKYGKTIKDYQQLIVGNIKITAIYTPGHTPGCVSYAVTDLESGNENVLVFTGDTLFVNDVGRTDFGGPKKIREWSENLYNSIFKKLLPLGDHVILCPAHGAGSVCGLKIAQREWSTLGIERMLNPLLQLSKEEFIKHKIEERHQYIPYFKLMEKYNVEGAPFLGAGPNYKALSPIEFKKEIGKNTIILDVRSPSAFGGAHIPNSYSIPKKALSLVGWFIPHDKPILIVIDDVNDLKYISGLARIGYDNVRGYLAGGLASWYSLGYPLKSLGLLRPDDLKSWLDSGKECFVLDVRSADEFEDGHIESATNIYVGNINKQIKKIPKKYPIVVVCETGNRASVAASILLKNGYEKVYNVLGGMNAWKELGYAVSK